MEKMLIIQFSLQKMYDKHFLINFSREQFKIKQHKLVAV